MGPYKHQTKRVRFHVCIAAPDKPAGVTCSGLLVASCRSRKDFLVLQNLSPVSNPFCSILNLSVVAITVATQAFLSVASLGSALPTLSATKASSFSEFSGLASLRSIQRSSPSTNSRRVALNARQRADQERNGKDQAPPHPEEVFRSNKHLYAQVIDESKQHTLASSSTLQKTLREELEVSAGPIIATAQRVGEEIAKVCLEKGITKVAFDRGGFVYHGRIQALADAARADGLDF